MAIGISLVCPMASRNADSFGAGALRAPKYAQGHPVIQAPPELAHFVRQSIPKGTPQCRLLRSWRTSCVEVSIESDLGKGSLPL